MSVDSKALDKFPFWKGESEKSRLRKEAEDERRIQLNLKKQKHLLAQIRSGRVKVPDGGARVEGRIAELEAAVACLARLIEQKEDDESRSQHDMGGCGTRSGELRKLEEQLAARLLHGCGMMNMEGAEKEGPILLDRKGCSKEETEIQTGSCQGRKVDGMRAGVRKKNNGESVVKDDEEPGSRWNDGAGSTAECSKGLGFPSSIQQLSGSHSQMETSGKVQSHLEDDDDAYSCFVLPRSPQSGEARERRVANGGRIYNETKRQFSAADAQPALLDSASSLGGSRTAANPESGETDSSLMPKKPGWQKASETLRQNWYGSDSTEKEDKVSQKPPIGVYPLVHKAGGSLCWLRHGVLEPIGGRLSREAIRATRARMRKELAEEASKEADRLAILLKISEDEEEERSKINIVDLKMTDDEPVSHSQRERKGEGKEEAMLEKGFHIRRTRLITIEEAADLFRAQEDYRMDIRDELLSHRPPLHKQLGQKPFPVQETTPRTGPNLRPGSSVASRKTEPWVRRGRDTEGYSSDDLSTDNDEDESEEGEDEEDGDGIDDDEDD